MRVFVLCLVTATLFRPALAQAPGDREDDCGDDDHTYPPDWHVLFDTWNYVDLFDGGPLRVLNDDGGSGWIPGGGGSCREQLRVCDFTEPTQPQSNWVFTQFINFEESTEIYVNTSYQYIRCINNAPRGCSTLQTTLYRYETNGEVDNTTRVNPANYLPHEVQVLSIPADQHSETRTTTFLSSATARGFYLGLLDTGTCGSIERITAYCRANINAECDTDNGGCNQTCTNTIGSFVCSCGLGYELNEDRLCCNDVDECDTNNGGCNQTCTNTIGSFVCSCGLGYKLNEDQLGCNDVDECDTDNGGCNQTCTNTIGSFVCSCGLGYELNEDRLGCNDVDECDRGLGKCDILAHCMNTMGSYDCACIDGYEGSGFNQDCTNIDECARNTDNCHVNATCMDADGSFRCTCLEGFRGNGIICGDVDECDTDNGGCNQTCTNTIGSFVCSCGLGYELNQDGLGCSEIDTPLSMKSNGYLVIVISVLVTVGVLVILIVAVVGVLIVTCRLRKKLTNDNQHIYETISLHDLEKQYNITINDAYVSGPRASAAQQNTDNTEQQSATASHCSNEANEGDEMGDIDSEDQFGSAHKHERDASVSYQAGDDYEQAQCYELAGGAYEQFKGHDYEQTSDPYERVQDYEQHQASGVYDQVQTYERLRVSDRQEQVEDNEQHSASGAYDQVQSYNQLQAHTVYQHIEGYEIVVQSRYCGLLQFKKL